MRRKKNGAGRPSRSAQYVLLERAVLAGMGVVDDPFARSMLTPSMAAVERIIEHGPNRFRSASVLRSSLAARTLWFDAQIRTALDSGVRQVAVIGAGYDSRAWRFRREGVQFFELDHPATQRHKQLVAPSAGPIYVAADLSAESALSALCRAGLSVTSPAVYLLEGVTMYLDPGVVRGQLCELASASASGTQLLVNFTSPATVGTARDRRLQRLIRLGRVGSGEKFRLRTDLPGAVDLVSSTGWQVAQGSSFREAAIALVPATSGLPVGAVSEHQSLVAAAKA